MNKKKTGIQFGWVALLLLATVWIIVRHQQAPGRYQTAQGLIFGTLYQITYQHRDDLKPAIDAELKRIDGSLSTFNDTSVISRINRNEPVIPDTLFLRVFRRSMEISRQTEGAFDITVAPLVNAWGFGFKHGAFPDSVTIDSLLQLTGYTKVQLGSNNRIVKQDPRIMLDCSAIAKGYAVDLIAELLGKKGCNNYMVDIGGEVVAHGLNPKSGYWRIGISKPVEDSLARNQELQATLTVNDAAIATSGNYRNYYYKDGKKYAHTVDPRTGYPAQKDILSATVVARDCMTADAIATACMVMGTGQARRWLRQHPEIDAYFIFTNANGENETFCTDRLKKILK
ncbi:MAG: FAD:protein FMN transferase [Prevotellaceae bacterium]|jgi:thiamine biosynthesis lipoprotein|nr:FAD:protein FMN transferase [Prevotellaceae bacterium]